MSNTNNNNNNNNNQLVVSLDKYIQTWVVIDNQMKILSEKMGELREKKSQLTNVIYSNSENSSLPKSVAISDGRLRFVETHDAQPLTFKFLESCLKDLISNEEQVQQIITYIKNKREIKIGHDIKRTYN